MTQEPTILSSRFNILVVLSTRFNGYRVAQIMASIITWAEITLPLGGSAVRPGRGVLDLSSFLQLDPPLASLDPPLASLDPPRGRVS
jgi:hypothetical protein